MGDKGAFVYREVGNTPWYRSLIEQLREPTPRKLEVTARPDPEALAALIEAQPPWTGIFGHVKAWMAPFREPFVPTAAPVAPPPAWSNQKSGVPRLLAGVAHGLVLALVLIGLPSGVPEPKPVAETLVPLYLPPQDILVLPPAATQSGGGGGGGNDSLLLPSEGDPPRAADRQFVPQSAEPPVNLNPVLVMEPTIVAPQLASLLPIAPLVLGDPYDGIPGPPSSGFGTGGGIGTNRGTGVGPGDGAGLGPGEDAGFGDGVYSVGSGVTEPEILSRREPTYSEEARRAQHEGTVVLEAIVRKDGTVEIVRVVRSLGLGLDEQAITAIREWTFRPAMRSGVPVDVAMSIQVNFNLN